MKKLTQKAFFKLSKVFFPNFTKEARQMAIDRLTESHLERLRMEKLFWIDKKKWDTEILNNGTSAEEKVRKILKDVVEEAKEETK